MPSCFAGALSGLGLKWKISTTIIGLILAMGLFCAILICQEIASARAKLIAIVVMALACGVVAALYLVNIIIRPLSMFIKNVEAMARGNLSQRMRLNANDEIGRLAGAFDVMVDKLEEKISERNEIAAELLRAKEDWEQAFDTINDAIPCTIAISTWCGPTRRPRRCWARLSPGY